MVKNAVYFILYDRRVYKPWLSLMTSLSNFANMTEFTKAEIPLVKGFDIESIRCYEVWKTVEAIRRYDCENRSSHELFINKT